MIGTVICSVVASVGLCAYILDRHDRKHRDDDKAEMVMGLGHDRIVNICEQSIKRGWISSDEYDNVKNWLFGPYQKMGGNGKAKRLMAIVDNLPMKVVEYTADGKRIEKPIEKK